jgi:hypothetical protein
MAPNVAPGANPFTLQFDAILRAKPTYFTFKNGRILSISRTDLRNSQAHSAERHVALASMRNEMRSIEGRMHVLTNLGASQGPQAPSYQVS